MSDIDEKKHFMIQNCVKFYFLQKHFFFFPTTVRGVDSDAHDNLKASVYSQLIKVKACSALTT